MVDGCKPIGDTKYNVFNWIGATRHLKIALSKTEIGAYFTEIF